jgi:hypothetical protein
MELGELRESWLMELGTTFGADSHLPVANALRLVGAVSCAADEGSDESLTWLPEQRAIATSPLTGGMRVALAPETLTLLVLDDSDGVHAELALPEKSGAEATAWIQEQLETAGIDAAGLSLSEAPGERPFACSDDLAHLELARSYGNASCAIRCALAQLGLDAPLRISADGTELTATISLPGDAGSMALAFGPADARCAEPHYAVQPCPAPKVPAELPELEGGGTWLTGEWMGAVLGRSAWTFYDAEQLQTDCAVSFLESAVEESAELMGASL